MKIEHHRQDELDWFQVTFRGANGCLAVLELGAHMPLPGHWARVDLMSRDGVLSVRERGADFSPRVHTLSLAMEPRRTFGRNTSEDGSMAVCLRRARGLKSVPRCRPAWGRALREAQGRHPRHPDSTMKFEGVNF